MPSIALSDWSHPVVEIANNGLSRERTVAGESLLLLAQQLDMLSLSNVTSSYRIERLAGGGYRLKGRVSATGEQACIVSLDPVPAQIDETFDVEFWPELPDASGGEDKAILTARDVEPLEDGAIPLGRIVFECLSAGVDPYPRKDGAEFSWTDKAESPAGKVSPFAALAKLKTPPEKK
ncbi:MAG: DUF177 domain-containing protein [Hyphomicrobium sp.]